MEIILEVIGEGGSITFAQNEKKYFFTTEEMGFEEFSIESLKTHSELYSNFYDGMIALLKKYPVFALYPEHINPQYKETIKIYFDNYLLYNENENRTLSKWESCLKK